LRRGEEAPAEPATAAGAILDRHGLAENRFEIPRKQSRRDVAPAARGVGHDHQDPARGKLLREARTMSDDGERRRTCGRAEKTTSAARIHRRLPLCRRSEMRAIAHDQLTLPDQGPAALLAAK